MRTSSHNEWDPLEAVIVGSVLGAQKCAFEPALGAYFPEDAQARVYPGGRWTPAEISEAEEQLDGLAELLQRLGVEVHRPAAPGDDGSVKTPDFSIAYSNSCACPRDVLLVLGDLIVEAPMAQRARFFEYRGYRALLKQHFSSGGRWLAAPKPFLDEAAFAADYTTATTPYDVDGHPVLLTDDPCFDAASFTRCGRDIFWQPDMVSNRAGFEWVKRAVGPDYTFHEIQFADRYPQHVDTTLIPLRPGLALVNPERPAVDDSLALFREAGWQLASPPPSVRAGLPAPARDVSNWISINLLMLDPGTAIVEQAEEPLMEFLSSHGVTAIPVPFDKVYKFGGGLHCCTVDIRRSGSLQSYF